MFHHQWLLHVVAMAKAFIPCLSGLYDSRMEIAILDFLMHGIYHIITTCRETESCTLILFAYAVFPSETNP
jgi:hypothetical protein